MDNIDSILNTLFSAAATSVRADTTDSGAEVHTNINTEVSTPDYTEVELRADVPATNNTLSDSDIDDILADNGFTDEVYDENVGEGRDVDIEALLAEEQQETHEEESERGDYPDYDDEIERHHPELSNEEVYVGIEDSSSMRPSAELIADTLNATADSTTVDVESSDIENSEENGEIPLNSPTLLLDEATTRFSGAEWFSEIQKQRIILAGVGGIGSNVALQLARMVPAGITLYDDDNVEMVNMAGQLYCHNDIGKAKVDAITDMISAYTTMQQIYAIKGKFTEQTEPGDIMICGFDNMTARRTFFTSWLTHVNSLSKEKQSKCLYIDGRLSMDTLQIFCIKGNDNYNINRYDREFLFTDSEAEATVCSMKQTTYLACMIGSLMVNLFTNFVANLLDPIIPYDLPFFTEYDAQNMLFKTEN